MVFVILIGIGYDDKKENKHGSVAAGMVLLGHGYWAGGCPV
jgi:hypothetical protein